MLNGTEGPSDNSILYMITVRKELSMLNGTEGPSDNTILYIITNCLVIQIEATIVPDTCLQ